MVLLEDLVLEEWSFFGQCRKRVKEWCKITFMKDLKWGCYVTSNAHSGSAIQGPILLPFEVLVACIEGPSCH